MVDSPLTLGQNVLAPPQEVQLASVLATEPAAPPAAAPPQQKAAPDPMANLARLAGVDMKTGGEIIRKYLQDGGVGLNPKELAWCAAAMNASLAQVGLPGTGSPAARSFLKYGNPVETPQHGDIVVFQRGGPNSNLGHVAYVDRINPDGTVRVLGGNQSQGVGYANYPMSDVLGFRRIPGAIAATDLSQVKNLAEVQTSAGGSYEPPAQEQPQTAPQTAPQKPPEQKKPEEKPPTQQAEAPKLAALEQVPIAAPTAVVPKQQDIYAKVIEPSARSGLPPSQQENKPVAQTPVSTPQKAESDERPQSDQAA